jgi:xylose isomerase
VRKEAAEYGIAAVEMASALGVNLITVCPLADGTDYPFEADYRLQWERLLEWLEVVSSQRADVRIALEYKPNEPRCHVILPNVGVCLHACHESGRENVGVTFDVGHAIYAGEVPAQSISFLAGSNKLFHVHVNDNYRNWDWDLLPGLVNYWDWIECMLYLERAAFDGWFVCDVFPTRLGPEQCVAASYRAITHAQRLLDRLDRKVLWELIDRGDVASTASYIQGVIESDPRAARTEAAE